MRLTGAVLVGTTTYVPGQESTLLGGKDRERVDWPQLERAGLVVFEGDMDRLRTVDPKAAKQLREAEAKVAREAAARAAKGKPADEASSDEEAGDGDGGAPPAP